MATVTKTWTFTGDAEGLTDAGADATLAFAHDATDNAVKFTAGSGIGSFTERARRSSTGQTWETWGVPQYGFVTSIQITAWKEKTVTLTGTFGSNDLTINVIDSSGVKVTPGDLISTSCGIGGTDGSYQSGAAGSSQIVMPGKQDYGTDVRLELQLLVAGSFTAFDQRLDDIELTITYTPPITGSGGASGGGIASVAAVYNLTASGGAVAAGVADVGTNGQTYNETGQGGATGNSSATTLATYNITAAGGSIGNSSAIISNNITEAATGGISGGSSGLISLVTSVTASGGAIANGSADAGKVFSFPFYPGEGTGGVTAGGTAVVAAGVIGSGGAVVNGAATGYEVNYGVLGSGTAPAGKLFVFPLYPGEGTGGATAGGSGLTGYEFTGTGGAVAGGAAHLPQAYNETGAGGATSAGSATFLFLVIPPLTGGATGGGTAIVQAVYTVVATGGSKANGAASFVADIIGSGGATGGGTALIQTFILGLGGIVGGGLAQMTSGDSITGSGGAITGGTVVLNFNHWLEGQGGAKCIADTPVTLIDYVDGTGGSVGGGAAVLSQDAVISGGATSGGSAAFGLTLSATTTGGIRGNGTAYEDFFPTPRGGVAGGGIAGNTANFNPIILSIGVLGLGEALAPATYNLAASGGIAGSGSGIERCFYNLVPTGGLQAAGQSPMPTSYNPTSSGGIVVAGTAQLYAIFNPGVSSAGAVLAGVTGQVGIQPAITGGAVVNGAAAVQDQLLPRGGAVVAGAVTPQATYLVTGTGGAVVGGAILKESPVYHYATSGAVTVEGSSNVTGLAFFFVSTTGSVVLAEGSSPALRGLLYRASGAVSVEGTALAGIKGYSYRPTGRYVYTGGTSDAFINRFEYVSADDPLTVEGTAVVTVSANDESCSPNQFACVVEQPNRHKGCIPPRFFYSDCRRQSRNCEPSSGAVLPAITVCRQKIISAVARQPKKPVRTR